MASPNVVARLQLNASQFSSEGGRAFAEMAGRARSASADVRDTFGTAYAEVGKIAQQALSGARTKTGSLDLSGEIASLKQSAAAADQRAIAANELRNAMQGAAFGTRAATEAALRDADAALVDKAAAEQQAAAIRQRIVQLEAYQVELNKASSAVMRHANDNRVSAEQQRQSTIMLGQQLQDFSVQVVSGQSVATAFAQQIGQASFALQGMGGKLAGVATFLTSGWGIAATIGATVLGPLVAKLLEGNDALGEAIDKLKKDAEATEVSRDAKERFARTEEGVAAAIRDGTKATNDAIAATKSSAEQANIAAKQNLARELSIRNVTLALIEQAEAEARAANSTNFGAAGGAGAAAAQTIYGQQLADLKKKAEDQKASIAAAEARVQVTRADLAAEAANRATDPMARLKKLYDDQVEAAKAKARAEGTVTAELTRQLTQIERKRRAAVKAEQERQREANRKPTADPDTATASSVAALLRRELRGVRITATTNGKHVTGSDHYKGAAIDFVPAGGMSSMTKADVRALFQRAGIPIRRNAGGVEQLFGPGDPGHSDHFHVAWEKGKLALDNYKASQVDAAKAARELKQQQEALDRELSQILKALDPLAAATARYTDRLADLAKLKAAGKITLDQQLDYGSDAQRVLGNDRSKIANDRFRDIFGADQVDAISREWDENVQRVTADWGKGLEDGARDAAEVLRNGVTGIADMFGVRMRGPLGSILSGRRQVGIDEKGATAMSEQLARVGVKIDPKSIESIGAVIGNASLGQIGGSAFASITGGKKSALGSSIGGALGGEAGKALGSVITKGIGGALGKTLGGAAGPIGAIAGGILGNVVGGLLAKTKKGSSTLTFGADGLSAGAATGNSSSYKAAAAASANSVVGALQRVAEALGGDVTGAGSVSIGQRKGKYVVDTTGRGATKGAGVLSFSTEEEAIKAAIADALKDGVVGGISAASKAILAAGGDLEKAINKAALIEAVPKDLKAMLDPLGAAIDELNRKFQKTVDALKDGGATAEQMADAQKLYDLQLAQVKASTASASQGLKDFLKTLNIGSDSPLSLRDREAAALADLKPYLTQIDAGQSIDQSKYQEAAKAYLDIERELYGSTSAFFEAFDAVQASTAKAIATIDNAVPVSAGIASPFAKETAASAAATAANTQTGNEIMADVSDTLANVQALLAQIASNTGASGGSDFIGSARLFANVAAA